MNFGLDQVDSSYSEPGSPLNVVGPSAWLGEMSSTGLVPPGTGGGTQYDYSF